MTLTEIAALRKPGRTVTGMAAVLVPFEEDGSVAADAYQACLAETFGAGLTPAVNMDTGYVNLLADSGKAYILGLASEVAMGRPFVAGAFIEGEVGEVVDLYRREMDRIVRHGGTPILFQTSRTHGLPPAEKAAVYANAAKGFQNVYAFELGRMFAPNGEIWDAETFERILGIPEIAGAKHSSLDRLVELDRLAIRDRVRPDFKVFTGNDLGIDMIEYGSDYLLGLAAFSPAKFAERDRLWAAGDPDYLALADALQFLGNVAFRPPVPAYKHSAATFLHLLGKIPTDRTHPHSPARPPWEAEMLRACAERLGLLD
jgi:dihydrodipicolinate synthase/N-acetylneuraminate lyase